MVPLRALPTILEQLIAIDRLAKAYPAWPGI
jgi:hypothetical protein